MGIEAQTVPLSHRSVLRAEQSCGMRNAPDGAGRDSEREERHQSHKRKGPPDLGVHRRSVVPITIGGWAFSAIDGKVAWRSSTPDTSPRARGPPAVLTSFDFDAAIKKSDGPESLVPRPDGLPPQTQVDQQRRLGLMIGGQLVNSARLTKTHTNTGLERASRAVFRPKTDPKLAKVWVKCGRKQKRAQPHSSKNADQTHVTWCARRDLNPRPIVERSNLSESPNSP